MSALLISLDSPLSQDSQSVYFNNHLWLISSIIYNHFKDLSSPVCHFLLRKCKFIDLSQISFAENMQLSQNPDMRLKYAGYAVICIAKWVFIPILTLKERAAVILLKKTALKPT